jgi:hypothetical protein
MKKAAKYLKRSADEMKVATALDDDDVAAIYSMQAEFAGVNGNTQTATDCGKFTRPEMAQRELGENVTFRATRSAAFMSSLVCGTDASMKKIDKYEFHRNRSREGVSDLRR